VCSGRCIQGALIIRYQKSNDSVLGLALGRRDRLRVRVQRQPRRGMPKQILLNLYIGSKRPKDTLNTSVEMCESRFAY
jgi:hypothetical protein